MTLKSWRDRFPSFSPVEEHDWFKAVCAVISDRRRYAFRCNRELVDVKCMFRSFTWREGRYVLKRSASRQAAEREQDLAVRAASRLKVVGTVLRVIVPEVVVTETSGSWLASPYLGPSLHEDMVEGRARWALADMLLVLGELRAAGLEWAGFAPRNLIVSGNGLHGIDWEDLRIAETQEVLWSELTLFKLAMNWALVFGSASRAHSVLAGLQLTWRASPLDAFEQSWRSLNDGWADDAAAREACNAICFASEQPVERHTPETFSAQELGHLVSDLLGSPLDVYYAAAIARLRRNDHNGIHSVGFLTDATRRVDAALRIADRCPSDEDSNLISSALLRAVGLVTTRGTTSIPDDLAEASRRLRHLRDRRGLAAALQRARLIEEVATALWRSARDLFAWDGDLQLLLRGSVANGICSIHSDLDYEISSPKWPNGFPEAEVLLGRLLDGFSIQSENSEGRPTDRDIVYVGGSRDVLEWLELRSLDGGDGPWPHTNGGRHRQETVHLGRFELEKRRMDGKHFWLAVRSMIARASALRGCNQAKTLAQLEWLRRVAGIDTAPLRLLLRQALSARELDLPGIDVEPLRRAATQLTVPLPPWNQAILKV